MHLASSNPEFAVKFATVSFDKIAPMQQKFVSWRRLKITGFIEI